MAAVAGEEVVIVRGEGVFVWDDEGRRYLDGSSSLWYANVGHGRSEIAEAIAPSWPSWRPSTCSVISRTGLRASWPSAWPRSHRSRARRSS